MLGASLDVSICSTPVLQLFLQIESPITCFIEVSGVFGSDEPCSSTRFVIIPCFYPVPLLIRHLWVGCTGSVKIVDLLTLTLVRTVRIPPGPNATTPPVVMVRNSDHFLFPSNSFLIFLFSRCCG